MRKLGKPLQTQVFLYIQVGFKGVNISRIYDSDVSCLFGDHGNDFKQVKRFSKILKEKGMSICNSLLQTFKKFYISWTLILFHL